MSTTRSLADLSVSEIRMALSIKERIATLESQLESVLEKHGAGTVAVKMDGHPRTPNYAGKRIVPVRAKRKIGRLRKPRSMTFNVDLVVPPAEWVADLNLPPDFRIHRIDKTTQARLDYLMDHNNEGTITSAEYAELSKMVDIIQDFTLENARMLAAAAARDSKV